MFGEAVLERLILGVCGERDRDRMGVAVTLEGKRIEVLSHIADHIQKTWGDTMLALAEEKLGLHPQNPC